MPNTHNNQIVWDETGQKFYETGLDRGVLYPASSSGTYPQGYAWNGLTAVTENPSGAEATSQYADNIEYINMYSIEEYSATVEAYTYPDEFKECIGEVELASGVFIGQQARKSFGMCYRTKVGNDVDGDDHAYLLHIIYGARAGVSERAHNTINDSPEAVQFSWELSTVPVYVTDGKPTASIVIDSRTANSTKLAALEAILYGPAATTGQNPTAAVDARLPLPDEIKTLMTA